MLRPERNARLARCPTGSAWPPRRCRAVRRPAPGSRGVQFDQHRDPGHPAGDRPGPRCDRARRSGVTGHHRGAPPVIRTSSSKDVGNTVFGWPPAAHTTGWSASAVVDQRGDRRRMSDRGDATDRLTGVLSDELRIGTGDSSRPPSVRANSAVSTRCAPEVNTSNGRSSAANTRLLAMAPIVDAQLAGGERRGTRRGVQFADGVRTRPPSRSARATLSVAGCTGPFDHDRCPGLAGCRPLSVPGYLASQASRTHVR